MDRQDSMGMGDDSLEMPDSPDLMLDPSMSKAGVRNPKIDLSSLKKNSGAPKRFKSSFIFFSMEKHKEIKAELQNQREAPKSTNITKLVSEAWRNLTPIEKTKYEDLAREDKARYELERANYKDERGISGSSKKKTKDPTAPKRPMSAFLAFANSRRAEVKARNPDCTNGEISKLLSVMWKEAPEEIKISYREDEAVLWKTYKQGMLVWRRKNDGRKKASKALEAAATLKAKKKETKTAKKVEKKAKMMKNDEEEPSLADNSFDDSHFGGFGAQGLESGNGGLNQDDIMAASAALRGVRSGPNSAFQVGASGGSSGLAGIGSGGAGLTGFDGGMQQNFQQGAGGLGALFGMNSINSFGTGGMSNSTGNSVGGTFGFGQDMGNSSANRALLEIGFPYQQYGSYAGVLGNNPQAMFMAQAALRGNSGAYLGLGDQQANLSQLASLAGGQNGAGALGQSPVSMGMGLGGLGGIGGMNGMSGMSGLMNDNSNNRFGPDGMLNNGF